MPHDVPATTHHIARFLKVCNLITGETNFSSSWDTFASSDKLCHGSTFTRQQCVTKTEGKKHYIVNLRALNLWIPIHLFILKLPNNTVPDVTLPLISTTKSQDKYQQLRKCKCILTPKVGHPGISVWVEPQVQPDVHRCKSFRPTSHHWDPPLPLLTPHCWSYSTLYDSSLPSSSWTF